MEPGFPCFRCGAAHGCEHRDISPPVRLDVAPPPRNGGNSSGGRYKLPRGAYNGLHARIYRTGSPAKSRI